MTHHNTRPTEPEVHLGAKLPPSSDVAAKMRLPWTYVPSTPLQADWIEDCNGEIVVDCIGHIDGPFIVERANAALSASPAATELPEEAKLRQVEVTDEMVEAAQAEIKRYTGHPSSLRSDMMRQALIAALTATDAKPVVPAEPVAWRVRERPGFDWRFTDYDPSRMPDLRGHEKQPLYAASEGNENV